MGGAPLYAPRCGWGFPCASSKFLRVCAVQLSLVQFLVQFCSVLSSWLGRGSVVTLLVCAARPRLLTVVVLISGLSPCGCALCSVRSSPSLLLWLSPPSFQQWRLVWWT